MIVRIARAKVGHRQAPFPKKAWPLRRAFFVRGAAYTNTVEGYFSLLKRGLIGTYHQCGEQHLHRYANEFSFRYNNRATLGVNDGMRTDEALRSIAGKRLTYRRVSEG